MTLMSGKHVSSHEPNIVHQEQDISLVCKSTCMNPGATHSRTFEATDRSHAASAQP